MFELYHYSFNRCGYKNKKLCKINTDDKKFLEAHLLYHQIPLPDQNQLDNIKQRIANHVNGVLLETPENSDQNTGFSIFAYAPEIILTKQNGLLQCLGFDTDDNTNDPLLLMQKILALHQTKQHQNLPFCGGFLGYMGYDYGQYLEKIPQKKTPDIDLPDLFMGFYPVAIVLDHSNHCLNICGIDNQQKLADELYQLCLDTDATAADEFYLTANWQSNMTEIEYQQKFNQVMQQISNGNCYQINLAQRWQAPFQGSPYDAFNKIKDQNSAPYSAFIKLEQGSIISVSPESFITSNNGHCVTKPIKGTRPRSLNLTADIQLARELQHSEKDRAENVMIVDLLRNDFSKVCKVNSVKVEKLCELESFAAVHHLVSTISGELEADKVNTDLLAACFPGGSITGAPKISAMEIIESLEPHKRSVYCGSIGYLSCNGKMDTSICIRTLVCFNQTIYCWAGGGLVVDSDVEQEYLETLHKVSKILPVLSKTLKK